ncbi:MAG: hypothetical protein GYB20_05710 [Oceanospirillales bacterium]|nr:hypothetical protein [Oceanospirillales bacterium]MBR9887176.1 hypothetical protein [Oceanospirillales bacterium]
MSKFLIVDDDLNRSNEIASRLKNSFNINVDDIDIAHTLNQGKRFLRQTYYTALFLDMALPKVEGDEPDRLSGINLLKAIARGRYKSPHRVIGYTALIDEVSDMSKEFEPLGFKLYASPGGDYSWLPEAFTQVSYSIQSVRSHEVAPKDVVVVSVHGILTFGNWQEDLIQLAKEQHSDIDISHLSFKCSRIDLITFLIPGLRRSLINRFTSDLTRWLTSNSTKRMICFSHSFGTYILEKSIRKICKTNPELLEPLELVVFSGSILKQNTDFSELLDVKKFQIINECAINDIPLLFSEAFVLDAGMSGRLGFSGICTDSFSNRFYNGGHSSFFDEKRNFIKNKWLPLIPNKNIIQPFNEAKDYSVFFKIVENLARISGCIKWFYPIILFFLSYKLIF